MILDLLICFYFIILFVYFLQGDACTSCPSAGAVVGDGVAVPGPKGEKGDPGPPGEGKSGKNVKALVYKWIYFKFCAVRIAHDELGFFWGGFVISGKARFAWCAGPRRSQRNQGVNSHLLYYHVYK